MESTVHHQPAARSTRNFATKHVDPVVRELEKCLLFTVCKLCRDSVWGKLRQRKQKRRGRRRELKQCRTTKARVWLFQLSGLSQQNWQNTLEGSIKKGIVDVLGHGRQTGEKYLVSHAYCQKLGTNHSAVICEAVVFTIQTARRSLKFGTQRFEDVIIPTQLHVGRRTFIQRQSQSTVMGRREDRCRANKCWTFQREDDLRNFDVKTIHTIWEQLEQRLSSVQLAEISCLQFYWTRSKGQQQV